MHIGGTSCYELCQPRIWVGAGAFVAWCFLGRQVGALLGASLAHLGETRKECSPDVKEVGVGRGPGQRPGRSCSPSSLVCCSKAARWVGRSSTQAGGETFSRPRQQPTPLLILLSVLGPPRGQHLLTHAVTAEKRTRPISRCGSFPTQLAQRARAVSNLLPISPGFLMAACLATSLLHPTD